MKSFRQELWFEAPARRALTEEALAALARFHAEQPLEPGAPLQWLRSRLRAPDEVSDALVAMLAAQGAIEGEQGIARLAAYRPRLSASQEALRTALMSALEAAGREPPSLEELAATLAAPVTVLASLARLLAREGVLVAVEPTRYYAAAAVDALVRGLRDGMRPERDYGPSDLRDMLGFSRKFLIPFLEFTDRVGHTRRDSAGRRRLGAA